MTTHEKIAFSNVRNAYNYIVGGYYNEVQDDNGTDWLPKSINELKEIIYSAAMTNRYEEGYEGCGKAPKEMRFAGEDFIRKAVDILCVLDEDGDLAEIAEYANW